MTGNPCNNWNYNTANSGTILPQSSTNSLHPGLLVLGTDSTSNAVAYLCQNGPSNEAFVLGAGQLTITWYFNIPTLSTSSQRYTFRIGLGDTVTGADLVNGCYLEYSDNTNSGRWVMKTANASTRTSTNTTTAVSTGFQVIQIVVNAAASSVSFSAGTTLAGLTSLGTAITTNIPTASVSPIAGITKSVGTTTSSIQLDLCTVDFPLTTAR